VRWNQLGDLKKNKGGYDGYLLFSHVYRMVKMVVKVILGYSQLL
jgi:hypothetical protein